MEEKSGCCKWPLGTYPHCSIAPVHTEAQKAKKACATEGGHHHLLVSALGSCWQHRSHQGMVFPALSVAFAQPIELEVPSLKQCSAAPLMHQCSVTLAASLHAGGGHLAAKLHAPCRHSAHGIHIVGTSGSLYDILGTSGTLYALWSYILACRIHHGCTLGIPDTC